MGIATRAPPGIVSFWTWATEYFVYVCTLLVRFGRLGRTIYPHITIIIIITTIFRSYTHMVFRSANILSIKSCVRRRRLYFFSPSHDIASSSRQADRSASGALLKRKPTTLNLSSFIKNDQPNSISPNC